jgi:hypothetical protein
MLKLAVDGWSMFAVEIQSQSKLCNLPDLISLGKSSDMDKHQLWVIVLATLQKN